MHEVRLPLVGTVAAWRREARALARAGVAAEDVLWRRGAGAADLFAGAPVASGPGREIRLPKDSVREIEAALSHSDPERFAVAYDLVLRLADGRVRWGDRSDPGVHRILRMSKAVARDIHKMHAFVRFRELPSEERRRFAAWFEPEHPCVEAGTPFFARRFGDMDWVVATPDVTARFVEGRLSFEETGAREVPPTDATEELWQVYYASIFNPARVMIDAMQAEMPKKYWKNLPEASLISGLIRGAEARVLEMAAAAPTEPPARRAAVARAMAARPEASAAAGLPALSAEAAGCQRCPLWRPATQVVFGEGPEDAALMIVGEQPGDREDLAGRPFVGPAGQVFDRVADAVGLDLRAAYVTNAVKHFKFEARGRRRIHKKASAGEVEHCRWWLERERALVRPKLILAMGATALQALTGDGARLLTRRGRLEATADGAPVFVTVHPSYILRLPDPGARAEEEARFATDLRAALEVVAGLSTSGG